MTIHLEEETVKRLWALQQRHKDNLVFVKVTVLLMLHQGFTPRVIAKSLGFDDFTVYCYRQGFTEW